MDLVERLAKDWEPFVNMGEGAKDTAIFFLNAIADEIDEYEFGLHLAAQEWDVARWLRDQADE